MAKALVGSLLLLIAAALSTPQNIATTAMTDFISSELFMHLLTHSPNIWAATPVWNGILRQAISPLSMSQGCVLGPLFPPPGNTMLSNSFTHLLSSSREPLVYGS